MNVFQDKKKIKRKYYQNNLIDTQITQITL
jgi:hypothetical protein